MDIYTICNSKTIFEKGDPASLFFVILSGKVIVKVNGK